MSLPPFQPPQPPPFQPPQPSGFLPPPNSGYHRHRPSGNAYSWISSWFTSPKKKETPRTTYEVESTEELDVALDASNEYIVIVLFYDDLCEMQRKVENVANTMSPVLCFSVNAYSLQTIVDECGIKVLPTVLIFRDGKMQSKLQDPDPETLDEVVSSLIKGWGDRRKVDGRALDQGKVTY